MNVTSIATLNCSAFNYYHISPSAAHSLVIKLRLKDLGQLPRGLVLGSVPLDRHLGAEFRSARVWCLRVCDFWCFWPKLTACNYFPDASVKIINLPSI